MRRNYTKVISTVLVTVIFLVIGGSVISCSNSKITPESLAQECCDCYQEMKSIQNETKRYRKLDEYSTLVKTNLMKLQELGVKNDWNKEQVEDARKRFDDILKKCSN
ncbi:hypothetical protein [Maribellus maritimus]|uniref:hypothetical protein n=1 Tax=Maribellus maritimus TaxID=2870838 RepID=UPI001EEA8981|nr:hypothetical protein [Maribellus maritimus]MCG6189115.1 hypothetical protein [Maribellus maritimus]